MSNDVDDILEVTIKMKINRATEEVTWTTEGQRDDEDLVLIHNAVASMLGHSKLVKPEQVH
jgi:hypothetical protein